MSKQKHLLLQENRIRNRLITNNINRTPFQTLLAIRRRFSSCSITYLLNDSNNTYNTNGYNRSEELHEIKENIHTYAQDAAGEGDSIAEQANFNEEQSSKFEELYDARNATIGSLLDELDGLDASDPDCVAKARAIDTEVKQVQDNFGLSVYELVDESNTYTDSPSTSSDKQNNNRGSLLDDFADVSQDHPDYTSGDD